MAGIIQRYESDQYRIPIFCLFFGQKIFDPDNLETPCSHNLFIAHDAGFSYRSSSFNNSVGHSGVRFGIKLKNLENDCFRPKADIERCRPPKLEARV